MAAHVGAEQGRCRLDLRDLIIRRRGRSYPTVVMIVTVIRREMGPTSGRRMMLRCAPLAGHIDETTISAD